MKKLSMRDLARALDFGAMSLYNHVANKDEILDGMIECVAEHVQHPIDLPNQEDSFASALDLILDGLDRGAS